MSAIETTLGSQYAWDISAQGGNTFENRVESFEDQINNPSGPPQDVIINLGTNDVFQWPTNGDSWQTGLSQLAGVAGFSGACVVWVNVSTYADALIGGRPVAESINAAIAKLAAGDPNFHVLDWNAFIHEGNNYENYVVGFGGFSLNVHPDAAGQQALAGLYAQALQQDCGN
jgi:lysophospholipase L1-like esterase